jgi:hypothetical protein
VAPTPPAAARSPAPRARKRSPRLTWRARQAAAHTLAGGRAEGGGDASWGAASGAASGAAAQELEGLLTRAEDERAAAEARAAEADARAAEAEARAGKAEEAEQAERRRAELESERAAALVGQVWLPSPTSPCYRLPAASWKSIKSTLASLVAAPRPPPVSSPSAALQVARLRAEAGETAERARRADASAEAAAAAARRRESGLAERVAALEADAARGGGDADQVPPPPSPSRTNWTRFRPSFRTNRTRLVPPRWQAHARARAAEARLGAAEAEGAAARREAEVHREAADAAREQLLAAQNALAAQDERRTALELNVALLAQARPALEVCLLVDSCRWQRPRVLYAYPKVDSGREQQLLSHAAVSRAQRVAGGLQRVEALRGAADNARAAKMLAESTLRTNTAALGQEVRRPPPPPVLTGYVSSLLSY